MKQKPWTTDQSNHRFLFIWIKCFLQDFHIFSIDITFFLNTSAKPAVRDPPNTVGRSKQYHSTYQITGDKSVLFSSLVILSPRSTAVITTSLLYIFWLRTWGKTGFWIANVIICKYGGEESVPSIVCFWDILEAQRSTSWLGAENAMVISAPGSATFKGLSKAWGEKLAKRFQINHNLSR